MSEESTRIRERGVTDRSFMERLVGDRPAGVAVRLVVVSIIVGFVMSLLGFNAQDVFQGAVNMVQDALRDSTGLLRNLWTYLLTGAALVVPIWLILRLTSGRRR